LVKRAGAACNALVPKLLLLLAAAAVVIADEVLAEAVFAGEVAALIAALAL
jgi:hypothetical protein